MPMRCDPPATSSICAAWASAWNLHDIDALTRLVHPNVDFITVAGVWLKGIQEFRHHHAEVHRLQMQRSTWTNVAHECRKLRDGLLLIHLQWTIAGDRDPDGTPRLPRRGIFTWLIAGRANDWRIVAAHNTNLREGIAHRLPNAA
jgi:uncharacterized protein (TIGR02246 family)